eukprot:TRINITY_DN4408_c0_g5_i1.p1 TRINITY_DN4408_c0_g5~~TRINITY_DN4408_c0_g5_i1.p1  ORF type:complete len:265 (+),score=124.98 TRINITY_DN4408_c0_g5_i1:73-867(+)
MSAVSPLDVYSKVMLEESQRRKWCNRVHSKKCGSLETCEFQHLDLYTRLPKADRPADVLCMMTKHVKNLGREVMAVLHAHARRQLLTWFLGVPASPRASETRGAGPFGHVVDAFRELGWVIPHSQARWNTTMQVEDAPYAADVAAIVAAAANMMHFQLHKAPEVMLKTLVWVLELGIDEAAHAAAASEAVESETQTVEEADDDDATSLLSMPELMDALDEEGEEEATAAECSSDTLSTATAGEAATPRWVRAAPCFAGITVTTW